MRVRTHFWILLLMTVVLTLGLVRNAEAQNFITVPISVSATDFTQLIASTSGRQIYVTGLGFTAANSVATGQTVTFYACTSASCVFTATALTGALVSNQITSSGTPYQIVGNPAIATPAGSSLAIRLTGTQAVTGWVTYNLN